MECTFSKEGLIKGDSWIGEGCCPHYEKMCELECPTCK